MTRRFTETDKWNDEWFLSLPPEAKLLFEYLCNNCDCAGFWEVNYDHASRKTGLPRRGELLAGQIMPIEDAMEECRAKLIWREDGQVVYLKNFLKHQGNWPLDRIIGVPYGKGIAQRFDAQGVFGKHVYQVLCAQPAETLVSDLIYGPDNPLQKKAAGQKIQDLPKSLSKGNGKGKKGAWGKRCLKRKTLGCRGDGVHQHTDDTGATYYLCDECEQRMLENASREE